MRRLHIVHKLIEELLIVNLRYTITNMLQPFKIFYQRFERFLVPSILLLGVLFDALTFKTISLKSTFILLFVYLIVVIGFIFYQYRTSSQNNYLRTVTPLIIQFFFGALLSSSLVFYWYSGALSVSWPLLVLVAVLMSGNEVMRQHFLRPTVQFAVLTFILFSFFSQLGPYIFNSLSVSTFLLSGVFSLLISLGLLWQLARRSSTIKKIRRRLVFTASAIFLMMNGLYFLNIIPPIPLSIRDAGLYYSINRQGSDYEFLGPEENFIDRLLPGQTIGLTDSEPLYAYTAIFAPAKLSTTIYHRWEFYNEETRGWETRSRLSFNISGGRDAGYRGYSLKTNLASGRWRVTVETERGQVLGRIPFSLQIE